MLQNILLTTATLSGFYIINLSFLTRHPKKIDAYIGENKYITAFMIRTTLYAILLFLSLKLLERYDFQDASLIYSVLYGLSMYIHEYILNRKVIKNKKPSLLAMPTITSMAIIMILLIPSVNLNAFIKQELYNIAEKSTRKPVHLSYIGKDEARITKKEAMDELAKRNSIDMPTEKTKSIIKPENILTNKEGINNYWTIPFETDNKKGVAFVDIKNKNNVKMYLDNSLLPQDTIKKIATAELGEEQSSDGMFFIDEANNPTYIFGEDKEVLLVDAITGKVQKGNVSNGIINIKKDIEVLSAPSEKKSSKTNTSKSSNTLTVAKESKSKTPYTIVVDLSKQEASVVQTDSKGEPSLLKTMPISSGNPKTPTPKGVFTTKDKGEQFTTKDGKIAKYYTRFSGPYLFHSAPLDGNGKMTANGLDPNSSKGCIRLSTEDAKWIYDNIPKNTTVIIG